MPSDNTGKGVNVSELSYLLTIPKDWSNYKFGKDIRSKIYSLDRKIFRI